MGKVGCSHLLSPVYVYKYVKIPRISLDESDQVGHSDVLLKRDGHAVLPSREQHEVREVLDDDFLGEVVLGELNVAHHERLCVLERLCELSKEARQVEAVSAPERVELHEDVSRGVSDDLVPLAADDRLHGLRLVLRGVRDRARADGRPEDAVKVVLHKVVDRLEREGLGLLRGERVVALPLADHHGGEGAARGDADELALDVVERVVEPDERGPLGVLLRDLPERGERALVGLPHHKPHHRPLEPSVELEVPPAHLVDERDHGL